MTDLEQFDRDGALAEARGGLSRAGFLAAAGTGLMLAIPTGARAAGLSKNDVSVLNYALSLEYLQAAFYTESERSKALKGRPRRPRRRSARSSARTSRRSASCWAARRSRSRDSTSRA